MSKRPKATILSFADLGPALRAKYATLGRPDEQAGVLPVHFAARDALADVSSENEARDETSDTDGD
jgi:hypothetical protein